MNQAVIKKDIILSELEAVTGKLLHLLSSFDQEQLNAIPFEGSWTPAQVGHHLYKSYKGLPQLLQAPAKPTERDPAQNAERIKKDFSDLQTKMKAPEFVVPELKIYDREMLLKNLQNTLTSIAETAQSLDLTKTCTAFSFPVYGELTRLEWLYFVIYHTKRHHHQLEKMAEEAFRGSRG
jgi:hypothetical protein